MSFKCLWKPYSFNLQQPLKTFTGVLHKREGLLLKLHDQHGGGVGWGEVSPWNSFELQVCIDSLEALGHSPSRNQVEDLISCAPGALGFGLGAAMAEIDGLIGKEQTSWLEAPQSAVLLPQGNDIFATLDFNLNKENAQDFPRVFKLKIAVNDFEKEKTLLFQILDRLPHDSRLRLDANGGLDRHQAKIWADLLHNEQRLEWLEQPLPANDLEGLYELAKTVPIALDESLSFDPSVRNDWPGWQVRRPIVDGDPRNLLHELEMRVAYKMVSTGFETGIGRRWVNHLAALQQMGPTPTAPGLAPGWFPKHLLFSRDPKLVWAAT